MQEKAIIKKINKLKMEFLKYVDSDFITIAIEELKNDIDIELTNKRTIREKLELIERIINVFDAHRIEISKEYVRIATELIRIDYDCNIYNKENAIKIDSLSKNKSYIHEVCRFVKSKLRGYLEYNLDYYEREKLYLKEKDKKGLIKTFPLFIINNQFQLDMIDRYISEIGLDQSFRYINEFIEYLKRKKVSGKLHTSDELNSWIVDKYRKLKQQKALRTETPVKYKFGYVLDKQFIWSSSLKDFAFTVLKIVGNSEINEVKFSDKLSSIIIYKSKSINKGSFRKTYNKAKNKEIYESPDFPYEEAKRILEPFVNPLL